MFTLPLILGTALALALSTSLTLDFTVHESATVERDGSLTVRGTVTCSESMVVDIEGLVAQEVNRSHVAEGTFFLADVECGPTPISWSATVYPDGMKFRPGSSSFGASATGAGVRVESTGFLEVTRSGR